MRTLLIRFSLLLAAPSAAQDIGKRIASPGKDDLLGDIKK